MKYKYLYKILILFLFIIIFKGTHTIYGDGGGGASELFLKGIIFWIALAFLILANSSFNKLISEENKSLGLILKISAYTTILFLFSLIFIYDACNNSKGYCRNWTLHSKPSTRQNQSSNKFVGQYIRPHKICDSHQSCTGFNDTAVIYQFDNKLYIDAFFTFANGYSCRIYNQIARPINDRLIIEKINYDDSVEIIEMTLFKNELEFNHKFSGNSIFCENNDSLSLASPLKKSVPNK